MSEEDDETGDGLPDTTEEGIDALQTGELDQTSIFDIEDIPLPPGIKRNLWKALKALVTGGVDLVADLGGAALKAKAVVAGVANLALAATELGVAKLEAKAENIRSEGTATDLVRTEAARAAAVAGGADPEFVERAVHHYASKIFKGQKNREIVAMIATEELRHAPPDEDNPREIDEDWLTMFSDVAESKSNEDIQQYLGKILAGEIRRPGTFSPATIHILSTLSQSTAQSFQRLCDISIVALGMGPPRVIAQPYGKPGNNALKPLGFDLLELMKLQSAGLLAVELETTFPFHEWVGIRFFDFAGKEAIMVKSGLSGSNIGNPRSVMFSSAGEELRKIISMEPNQEYLSRFQEWLNKVDVTLKFSNR